MVLSFLKFRTTNYPIYGSQHGYSKNGEVSILDTQLCTIFLP